MNTSGIEIAAAKVVLGLLRSDDLASVAVQALVDGYDSPSLRILAGQSAVEADGARSTFERALSELGVATPSKRDAIMRLARETAREIVRGAISADAGAKQIWNLTLSAPRDHVAALDPFVYAASEWDDRPEDHAAFAAGIVAAAEELVLPHLRHRTGG